MNINLTLVLADEFQIPVLRQSFSVISHFKTTDDTLKTTIISFLILTLSQIAFGQNRTLTDDEINNSSATKLMFVDTSNYNQIDLLFKKDIENKTVFLFLQSGIAPVTYTTDQSFENKYGIYFHDFGCLSPDRNTVLAYNIKVFEYLTKYHQNKWKKDISKDVIGLKEWKKKKNGL